MLQNRQFNLQNKLRCNKNQQNYETTKLSQLKISSPHYSVCLDSWISPELRILNL